MTFTFSGDWHCSFHCAVDGARLPVSLVLQNMGRLYMALERGRALVGLGSAERKALFRSIEAGHSGGV